MQQFSFLGSNSLDELSTLLLDNNSKNVLLVHDNASFALCGAEAKLKWVHKEYDVVEFSEFELNPKLEDVIRGVQLFEENNIDCIVAVGGGSVIDMAKLINYFSANNLNSKEFTVKDAASVNNGKMLIAVPTTSGTGSEATHFAVFYVNKVKHSAAHKTILPDVAIIDPSLSSSQPPYISAASGMDALCQAIESYWSIYSTDESQSYSRDAIKLILLNLVKSVVLPNPEVRFAMAKAAYFAGKAINITKTTAPHAVSYPITSYFGVAHGHAVGLTLPSFLEFNGLVTDEDISDRRGVLYVRNTINQILDMFGVSDLTCAKVYLEKLMSDIGLETRLSKLGIVSDDDIELIISNGFNPERVRNNPRFLNKETLKRILYLIQ